MPHIARSKHNNGPDSSPKRRLRKLLRFMSSRKPESDSRKRQSKKDEAIRRKLEHEISKRRGQGPKVTRKGRAAPGTVLYLRPSEPLVCKPSATVFEAARLMSARRENCVLVVDDDGGLAGIFTAKDLAFRIVGAGLKPSVAIELIMTPTPICAYASDPASDALNLMVERGFRHLPVLDDDGRIVGVLDITRLYAQQMEKLERLHSLSMRLHEALDLVHLEVDQPPQVLEYFADLKARMNGPTLRSVLDKTTHPAYVGVKSTVYDATLLMKENHTTAVLVRDSADTVGIFTLKDVVLRVIAAGLDPTKCSVVRVMTPQPDVAAAETSIQVALRQMFEGNYLNLPVVDDGDIIGMVDVLRLTYATLNQIKRLEGEEESGPAWNTFWTSLDELDRSETASAPDVTPSEFQLFDIAPSDSVSAAGKHADDAFVFKFRSPAVAGRVHRVSLPSADLESLRGAIDDKLHARDLDALRVGTDGLYAISYVDDDGDVVSITSDGDVRDCIRVTHEKRAARAELFLHNPHETAPVERQVDIVQGVPNALLILGALGLASVIAAAFIVTRR